MTKIDPIAQDDPNQPPSPASYSPAKNRILSIDAIRGFAILGILIMNIVAHAIPFEAYENPLSYGASTMADHVAWITSHIFANGTMRALFSILFGVSIILLTQNKNPKEAKRFFMWRSVILLAIGLFHAHVMLFFGDILFSYALVGMIVFFWRNMTDKKLYYVTGGILLFKILLFTAFGYLIAWAMANDPVQSKEFIAEAAKTHEFSLRQIASHSGSYLEAFAVNSELALSLETIMLPIMFLDISPLMLVGFILYRKGIITGDRTAEFYKKTLIIGLFLGLTLNSYMITKGLDNNFSMSSQMFNYAVIDISRIALALAFISALHLMFKKQIFTSLTGSLAAVGKMALTNYLGQSLIALILFNGFGFNLFNKFGRAELLLIVVLIWAFQVIFSKFWLKSYRFGPVEWLWRSLTYRRMLENKRVAPEST